jgi:hypothetical protein
MVKAKESKTSKKKITRLLPVRLTAKEAEERAQSLAATKLEIDRLSVECKVVNANFKDQLKGLGEQLRRLANVVKAGEEQRDVACEVTLDFTEGNYYVLRLDTGEFMDTRPLTEGERQLNLPQAEKAKGA